MVMASSDDEISNSSSWKERIMIPTIAAGVVGGGFGLLSKHKRALGVANTCSAYAANFAIVTGCYCGAREFVRVTRASEPGDLINSAIGGLSAGALLGRLQGGQFGAIKYSVIFAVVGTTVDFAIPRVNEYLQKKKEDIFGDGKTDSWLKVPEWSPIQVLDEEALAAKRAREQKLYGQTAMGSLKEEET